MQETQISLAWYVRNQLYRIIQEALNNAVKHAEASNIEVSIVVDAQTVRVEVADDGKGHSQAAEKGGFGITTMYHRAAAIHARLLIDSRPTGGTIVICECPQ